MRESFSQTHGCATNGANRTHPLDGRRTVEQECLEWCPICRGTEILRATVPPEVTEHWNHLQRDALLVLKAIIDYQIDKLAAETGNRSSVEDIPID